MNNNLLRKIYSLLIVVILLLGAYDLWKNGKKVASILTFAIAGLTAYFAINRTYLQN